MSKNHFNEIIDQSNDICSNCFARIYERESYNQEALKQSLRGVLTDDVTKTDQATTEYHRTYSAPDSRSVHCSNCGSDREYVHRPVTLSEALEYGTNLSKRINESDGVEVNPNALKGELRRLKKEDTNQYTDNTIYSAAVNQTVAVCD